MKSNSLKTNFIFDFQLISSSRENHFLNFLPPIAKHSIYIHIYILPKKLETARHWIVSSISDTYGSNA